MRKLLIIFIGLLVALCLLGGKSVISNDVGPLTGIEKFDLSAEERKLLTEKAIIGSGEAAFSLYQYFEFVQDDYEKSGYWLEIAAENNHSISQFNFAINLLESDNVLDKKRAVFWLKKSYQNGNKKAGDLLDELQAK